MNGDKNVVTGRMLFGDAIITFLLINEARRRIVVWVFGVPKEDSELITVIATGFRHETATATLPTGVQMPLTTPPRYAPRSPEEFPGTHHSKRVDDLDVPTFIRKKAD